MIGEEPTNTNPLQKLRAALHDKAKSVPNFRFYSLYDKVYRRDVLEAAWCNAVPTAERPAWTAKRSRTSRSTGVDRWLDELTEELRTKRYQPQPVRRVYLPKPDGKQRPLGIPTIRDRVVQTAALLILEPIFEADLQPEQHAYRAEPQRPGGGAGSASLAGPGVSCGGRCGSERVLRQHPAPGTDAVRRPSRERQGHAAPDEAMAGGAGGRNRRAGPSATYHAEQGHEARHAARRTDFTLVGEPVHATFRAGLEDPRA